MNGYNNNTFEVNSMIYSCNRLLMSFNNFKVFNLVIVFLMMHITSKNYVKARNSIICDNDSHQLHQRDHHQQAQYRQKHQQQVDVSDPPFIEYYMEHQVSEKEARKIISQIKSDELEKPSMPWCEQCTPTIRSYCMAPSFLRDHCCCDQRHEKGKNIVNFLG